MGVSEGVSDGVSEGVSKECVKEWYDHQSNPPPSCLETGHQQGLGQLVL